MMRRATVRSIRRPVLALVAAAGLVVWTGAGTSRPFTAGPPVVPGEASISGAEQARGPALKTTGGTLQAGLFDAADRQPPRTPGAGSPASIAARSFPACQSLSVAAKTADPGSRHALALSRAGRDSAPPTAPPPFPS